jgi:hypothetical protein
MSITIGGETIEFPVGIRWPGGLDDLMLEGGDIVKLLLILGGIIAVVMIVVSGYTLITASGNPEKIQTGTKTLTGAVIGLVIVFIAYLLVAFITGDLLDVTI